MGEIKDRLNKIENLYKKIFLLILGSILMVIPFWAGGLAMLLLSENTAEWTTVHTIFLCSGIIFFVGGWAFNSIAKAIVGFVTKKSGE